ncbi:MAG TPA: hypothetical protein VIF57_07345 [Polyangia bacterium]|jgi:hypothetical protein
MVGKGRGWWAVAIAATGLALGCERGTLDKAPPDGRLAADGGIVLGSGAPGGPGAGSGAPGSGTGGDGMPVIPACVVSSRVPDDWSEVAAPGELAGFRVTDGWAAPGRNNLFFAAVSSATGSPPVASVRIARWTGGCWTAELSWSTSSTSPPSLAGAAGDDVWATVGDAVLHRDATSWTRVDGPLRTLLAAQHPGVAPTFDAVRVGDTGVWVTGGHFVWRRDQQGWRMFELSDQQITGAAYPTPGTIRFTALQPDLDGAVLGGSIDFVGGAIIEAAFVCRYDGSNWTPTVVGRGRVTGLENDGAGGLWIGAASDGGNPSLWHLDGTGGLAGVAIGGWPSSAETQALWARAGDDVWAASGAYLAHWDGSAWTSASAPPGTDSARVTVLTGDGGSLWFVGAGPRFFRIAR